MNAQAKLSNDVYTTEKPDLITRRLLILNLKSVDHVSASGGGSIRSLGWAEISAALSFANLDDISYLIVRVIHCHDKQSAAQLIALFTATLIQTKKAQGQDICSGKQDDVRKLVTVAIYDYLQPNDKRPVSTRQRASIAGFAAQTYRDRGYNQIVDGIIEQLEDRYAVARMKIHKQLVSQ